MNEIVKEHEFTFEINGISKIICRELGEALNQFIYIFEKKKLLRSNQVQIDYRLIQIDKRPVNIDFKTLSYNFLLTNRKLQQNAIFFCKNKWLWRFKFKCIEKIRAINDINALIKLVEKIKTGEIKGKYRLDHDRLFNDEYEIGEKWNDLNQIMR